MIKNFIILGTQRTGSTALYRTLNFHPDIACGGEWIHDQPANRKLFVARKALQAEFSVLSPRNQKQIAEEYHDGACWLGFKALFRSSDLWLVHPRFSPALWLDRLEAIRRWIASEPGIHVIHLTRDDQIEWLKSKYLSSKTGLYTNKPYPTGMKVTIPIKPAIRRLQTKNWIDSRIADLAGSNPFLHVSYEDFLLSKNKMVENMMQFLECDMARLEEDNKTRIKKQSKGSAADYIANFDELREAIERRGLSGRVAQPAQR
jgi:LPS sulfotransferase NodH